MADQDSYEGEADAVTLITLHAAKGLEFPVVFIAGLEEGVFPHAGRSRTSASSRRSAAWRTSGITRAKRRLFLSNAWRRATWGMGRASVPSRFLLEIPAELMVGPSLRRDDDADDDGPLDLDLVFGARRTTRFGTPIRAGWRRVPAGQRPARRAARPGGGPVPADARPRRQARCLRRRRASGRSARRVPAWDARTMATRAAGRPAGPPDRRPPGPPGVPPGRSFRASASSATATASATAASATGSWSAPKLTRDDEEVTVAFRDPAAGRKTLLASLANLELIG